MIVAATNLEQGVAWIEERLRPHAVHLVVHGILHLAGFDHAGDADAGRMEAAEGAVLARFGIPDPYRDDSASLANAL